MSSQVTTTGVKSISDRSTYLSDLVARCRAASPAGLGYDWLKESRDRTSLLLQEQALPSTRDEEWRFTDLSPLLPLQFHPGGLVELPESAVTALPEASESRLVFVNGFFAPALSKVAGLPAGAFVGNLAHLPSEYTNRLRNYLTQQQGGQEVFTALNTASFADVAVVWVPKNVVVETPIHLLLISVAGASPTINHPRCLVVAEPNSAVTLVEEYVSHPLSVQVQGGDAETANPYLTNAVTEVWVGENAQVNHTRIQWEGEAAFHIGRSAIAQARDSRYTCHAISLGAQLSRHDLDIFQTGEQTDTTLNGLTILGGEQVGDTHSAIALNYPHGTSRQLHKCIVDDRAHAVFNGKVFVPKAAQLTDAGQMNRNLLLSPKARVDTKPQLEITADNVKCAHGATVSQLDEEEVFYLQSRGINETAARYLLINAFAAEIIEQIPIASLREKLSSTVRQMKSL